MYAIVETGGKQYRVSPGDVIRVETLEGETGATTALGRVLAVSTDEGKIVAGQQAAGATVQGTILSQDRAKKILVFHYKKKKQYKKMQGHRQNYTEVRVDNVSL
jgi:large subunit ribosomal protein L21